MHKQEALNTIQHELEHVYQQLRSGKRIPGNDDKYLKMKSDMECNDEARQKVGRLVYLCCKSEQEAFINGTYAWCMTNDAKSGPYQYEEIKNSPAGKLYVEMQELYDEVKNVLDPLGITVEQATELFFKCVARLGRIPFDYSDEDIKTAEECCKVSEVSVFEDIKTGIEQAIEYERKAKNDGKED